ncbi:hypothetical protein HY418_02285 [Candidatus Kaiserbacteria bacterium]|nr:hypothetical protein [Candidatus Kaiserbacteria bacterium]
MSLLHVFIPLVAFTAVFSFFFLVMRPRGLGLLTNPPIASIYFLLAAVALSVAYSDTLFRLFEHPTPMPFVWLLLFYATSVSAYSIVKRKYNRPDALIARHGGLSFLTLDHRFLFSKSFEILFQQIVIATLILSLASYGLTLPLIMLLFAVFFGAVHAFSVFIEGKYWAVFFGVSSVLSGLVLPPLILLINYGLVYSFVFHGAFYVFAGCFFWVYIGGPKTLQPSKISDVSQIIAE